MDDTSNVTSKQTEDIAELKQQVERLTKQCRTLEDRLVNDFKERQKVKIAIKLNSLCHPLNLSADDTFAGVLRHLRALVSPEQSKVNALDHSDAGCACFWCAALQDMTMAVDDEPPSLLQRLLEASIEGSASLQRRVWEDSEDLQTDYDWVADAITPWIDNYATSAAVNSLDALLSAFRFSETRGLPRWLQSAEHQGLDPAAAVFRRHLCPLADASWVDSAGLPRMSALFQSNSPVLHVVIGYLLPQTAAPVLQPCSPFCHMKPSALCKGQCVCIMFE